MKNDMKKKLIFISEALWIGGIETALVNLLNRLDYEKYDVTCLVVRNYTDMAGTITNKCRLLVADRDSTVSFRRPYKYKRLYHLTEEPQRASKLRYAIWKLLRFLLRAIEMRLYSRYISECLDGEKFDTAVIFSDRTAEIATRAVNADRFLMFYHHGAMRREYHDSYGYKKSEKVIAVSEAVAKKLREYRPKFADKIVAICNLTDVNSIREKAKANTEVKFDKSKFNIVSCGRIAKEKGLDLAAEAVAELVSRGEKNIAWYVVGGGPEENLLKAKIKELGIEKYVCMLGMQANPYPYIAKADLFIQPSRFEGYSGTILEARILGLPIVATYAAAEEQIENGVNGLLCETKPDALAEAIALLANNFQVMAGFRRNLENYDFEEQNKKIMKQLYMLL